MHQKDATGLGDNIDPEQTASLVAVRFGTALYQGCQLSFTSKFLDFSLIFPLTFYSFPYHLKKNILYFNAANYITSNLGTTLKGKNLLPVGANSFL